jgi:hypothetical protein
MGKKGKKKGWGKKSRNFLLTLNQVDRWDNLYKYLKSLESLNYLIAAKEIAPETGHEHIHCYAQFRNAISLSKKKTENAHIDICRGSPQQNKDYVEKEGNVIIEEGTMRNGNATSIKDVKNMKKTEREDLPFIYYDKVMKLNEDECANMNVDEYYKNIEVYYIWGDSGVGKTKKAHELIKSKNEKFHEAKHLNGFWIGVSDNEECRTLLYDDFRDTHMKPSEFINFIDYNIHNMNIKGGYIKNKYNNIIITSVQNPETLYEKFTENDKEPMKQWMRRLTHIIHLDDSAANSNI